MRNVILNIKELEKYQIIKKLVECNGNKKSASIKNSCSIKTINRLINTFVDLLSNALTENVNGKLDIYIEISHGINNLTRFRKRTLYALNPTIFYSSSNILKSDALSGKPRGKYKKIKG